MISKLKKVFMVMLVIIMAAIPVISNADALSGDFWDTVYQVDYDVQVTAPDGGVNLRDGAGAEYGQLIDKMISNGTSLHISLEARAENGKLWGQTNYAGITGWVFLGHCTKLSELDIQTDVEIDEAVAPDEQNTVSGDVFADPNDAPTPEEQEEGVMKINAADSAQPAAGGSSGMTTMILVIIALLIVAVIITAVVLLKKMNKK